MASIPIHRRNLPPPAEKFDHPSFIEFIANWVKPQNYLELGVRNSPVLNKMIRIANTCIGVDLNPCHFASYDMPPNLEFHQMSSDDFFAKIMPANPRTLDMVFIDANHSHEASLRDFDNAFPHVIEDGFIFLHDTYPISEIYTSPDLCHDAYKTAWYIRKNYGDKCEIITLPFQPGLTIVKKSHRQLQWMSE